MAGDDKTDRRGRGLVLALAALAALGTSCGALSGEERRANDESRAEGDGRARDNGRPVTDTPDAPNGSPPVTSTEEESGTEAAPTPVVVVGLPPSTSPSEDEDGICETASVRCNGSTLERCAPESGWLPQAECESSCLCELGLVELRCAVPSCAGGEFRCVGPILQRCTECRTSFEIAEVCASSEACDPAAGRCVTEELADAGAP